jgi:hypothetical protein
MIVKYGAPKDQVSKHAQGRPGSHEGGTSHPTDTVPDLTEEDLKEINDKLKKRILR